MDHQLINLYILLHSSVKAWFIYTSIDVDQGYIFTSIYSNGFSLSPSVTRGIQFVDYMPIAAFKFIYS